MLSFQGIKKAILITFIVTVNTSFAFNTNDFLNDPEHLFWFDINDVPTIELVFDEVQWQLLLTSDRNNRKEVNGNLVYLKNNVAYPLNNIGIKLSGNTSFTLPESPSDAYIQANFSLDFDEFVDDQKLSGVSALKLKRFHGDSTFVHEPLSNQIMQNFDVWTAHSSTYVKLNITIGNRGPVYYGMYRLNESVNRREYLDKRFGTENDGGFLWQGNYKDWGKAHFSRINESWEGVGDFDEASFEYKGKGSKYPEARAQLVEFAQSITDLEGDEFEKYIEQHINIPLLLKGLASEAVLGHWDGFWGNGNNYQFYIDEQVVMHFIPYDTDNTLGTSLIVSDVGEQDPVNFSTVENAPLLVTKILSIDKYLQEYKQYIELLVTQENLMVENYAVDWIQKRHLAIQHDLENITGDNQTIKDQPAVWGNQDEYRLLELSSGKNWYQTRLDAVEKALTNSYSIYDSVYFRGVTNNWNASLMIEDPTNIWTITVDNNQSTNSEGEPRFKFDIFSDWSQNFGDDDADGYVEESGADILFKDGFGRYLVTFDAKNGNYAVDKIIQPLIKPTANAGTDIFIFVGDMANFDASASIDTDGEIIMYAWSNGLTSVSASLLYEIAGTYEVTLTVTDNDQQTAIDTVTVSVKDIPLINNSSGGSHTWLLLLFLLILRLRFMNQKKLMSRCRH